LAGRLNPGAKTELTALAKTAEAQAKEIKILERLLAEALRQTNGICLLPPRSLRLNVGMVTAAANFWNQGRDSSRRVIEVFGEKPPGPVLDWGCGSGRTLNWLWAHPDWREAWRGCDVDAAAIAWLRGQGVGAVEVCGDLPPLPYPDSAFAGVYSFSVLTHIHPKRHRAWLQEIRRVLEPGGRAYLTFNSDAHVADQGAFAEEDRRAYREKGWCYAKHPGHYKSAAAASWAYVQKGLEGLEVERHRPSGYHRMDDLIVRRL
jgi:SAM-dependent methyltransferase